MNYEILHGSNVHYVDAGNQYAACIDVLLLEAKEDKQECGPFIAVHLTTGKTETIPMALVLKIQLLALNPYDETLCDEWGAPPMDLNHW